MYDCVIIGGGPCGVACAIYLKQAGYDVVIVEEMIIGGQPLQTNNISNVVGFIGNGEQFGETLSKQLKDNNIEVLYGFGKIVDNKLFLDDNKIETKSIVIATGAKPNKIDIIKKPYYCSLCDGNLFKNKKVIVIGSGNSAYSEALHLSKIAKEVTLLQNVKFPILANNELKDKVNSVSNIHKGYYEDILEDDDDLLLVTINGEKHTISYDGIFVSIGRSPNLECIDNYANLNVDENYNIINGNIIYKNIFAGGDVLNKPIKQISTAINDGVVLSQKVIKYLRGE